MAIGARAFAAWVAVAATAATAVGAPGDSDGPAAPPAKAAPGRDLPGSVDLRKALDDLGLDPRCQGARNTCSVLTTTGALEFAVAKHRGKGVPLSPEFLNWACNRVIGNTKDDRGQFFHHLLQGFEKDGICAESEMPYRERFDPAYAPSVGAVRSAKAIRDLGLRIHWINPWKPQQGLTEEQFLEVRRVLAAGWPVAAGSDHSRLLVGYAVDGKAAGGGRFLAKDSGSGSYNEVTFEFVRTKVGDVFWVETPEKPKRAGE